MLYPSVRAPMRAPITPVLASTRSAARPVGANFGGVGSSETSAILIIGLSMSPPPFQAPVQIQVRPGVSPQRLPRPANLQMLRITLLIHLSQCLNPRLQDPDTVVDELLLRQISPEKRMQQLGRRCIKSIAKQISIPLLEFDRVMLDHVEHLGG